MIKPLLKKLSKFVFILILSLIIFQCIGYLTYTYGFKFSNLNHFISNHFTESLFVQLFVICILVCVWPYAVNFWLSNKSHKTSFTELDNSDKEFFDFISSRKCASCFLGILFMVVNIL